MAEVTMLPGFEEEILALLRPRLEVLKDQLLAGAKADTPVSKDPEDKPGHLRDSNFAEVKEDGTIVLGNSADYALDVEFGTEHMTAEPYLRPQIYRFWGKL